MLYIAMKYFKDLSTKTLNFEWNCLKKKCKSNLGIIEHLVAVKNISPLFFNFESPALNRMELEIVSFRNLVSIQVAYTVF